MKLGHHFFLSTLKKNDVASNFKTASESGFKFKEESPPWVLNHAGFVLFKSQTVHAQTFTVFLSFQLQGKIKVLRAASKSTSEGKRDRCLCTEIKQGHEMCPPALVVLSMGARCLQFVILLLVCAI